MSSALTISSVVSANDAQHATVVLSGSPFGTLEFRIGSTPSSAMSIPVAFTIAGQGRYVLAFPRAGLWYVWAHDANGFMIDSMPSGEPIMPGVWIGRSTDQHLDAVGVAIRNVLATNRTGIEAAARSHHPNTTIKQIAYGYEGNIFDWPAILVSPAKFNTDHYATGNVWKTDYTVQIVAMVVAAEEQSEIPLASVLAASMADILCGPDYEELVLSTGLHVVYCEAKQGESSQFLSDEGHMVSIGSCVWSGMALLQRPG